MSGLKFNCKSITELLDDRGLLENGRVQQVVDSEVVRRIQPYIPLDTGELAGSVQRATRVGSGEVIVDTPYARRQNFKNPGGEGLRGPHYFDRMKADHKDDILTAAQKAAKT